MRVLVLGGTTEATALARALAGRVEFAPTLSLAGRTDRPAAQPIPARVGGFGGVAGLADYLRSEGIEAVVDATHPFAARMSEHAAQACREAGVPLVALTRPPWTPGPGDRWIDVPDMAGAVDALGEVPRTVFLTVGRLSLPAFAARPEHTYVVRTIDEPGEGPLPPRVRLIRARGPFAEEDEVALMRREGVDIVVSKNSGGEATSAKLAAARRLGLPVVMVRRPPRPETKQAHGVAEALGFLERHRRAP
ncbi:cobalt-precorrin-6A reductase [Alsobacter sp. SYSU M60028]|uniref:Cobalt-precorrin-6A reductase n=1 Tax=Alsobacter ponti TaxID=2962936 RepID=A0ABT1LE92_9HYPH|nr:cobalt-precorrin-6A reductase [Alsobacter ponti]MCP8939826.1 cobalt-precorrin-6A reductase [Alsobacter ponti]